MTQCRHQIEISTCAECNGFLKKQREMYEVKRQEKKKETVYYFQRESLKRAERHNYPVEEYEIEIFLEGTDATARENLVLFDLALLFKRTFNSMVWMYKALYYPETTFADGPDKVALMHRCQRYKNMREKMLS